MVGEQDLEVSAITAVSESTCTVDSTRLDQRPCKDTSSSPEEQEQRSPGPTTPITSATDEVTIETCDGSLFQLSRWRLASESLFFRALFHGNYKDSKSSRVRLCCVGSTDFQACLSLSAQLYSGSFPKFSVEAAMELMVTASFLQMTDLMEELVTTVVTCVHPSNRLAVYREATVRSGVLANKLWSNIVKEFRWHLSNNDYVKMTESEILNALVDERLDVESREEKPLINKWIAKNPRNHSRMLRLKHVALGRRGTDGQHHAVIRDRVPREIVVAIGGWSTGGPSDIVEVFNPRSHNWVVPESPIREIPRAYHGAAICGESLIVIGGFDGREFFQHSKIFDLNKKTWEGVSNMHERRCYVAVTPLVDPSGGHRVVAVGGCNGHRRLNTGEIYEFEKNHWFHLPVMLKPRSDAAAVILAGRPTVIGGFDGGTIHNDIEFLDFNAQTWTSGSSSMRSSRTGVSAVTYEDNTAIVVGGFNGVRRLKTTEFYDQRVGLWHTLPEMKTTRSNFGMEIINGTIYVAGGFDGNRTTSAVERFDMRAYKWQALPSMSVQKSALRLVRISDHEIIKSLVNFYPGTFDYNLDFP